MTQKTSVAEFALFGGHPAFNEALHVGRPNIGNRQAFLARVESALDRGSLTNDGPLVREFEAGIADLLGVEHCVAVCNATVGLEIAIRALGMTGDVIVPSMTFVATAHALQWQQVTPVFADIDPATHNLDPVSVRRRLTPRTTGILGVHLWGRPSPIEALDEIAQKHGLKLLFDAAHAFNCSYGGRMVGNFGDAEVLSFHATKFFNTLEGGAIVTNNAEVATRARLMRNFGFAGYDQVVYPGTNGKMNEISAAMGLSSLDSLDLFVATNRHNYFIYREQLAGIPGISLLEFAETDQCNLQYVVLEIEASDYGLSRDDLMRILWAENVRARRYFFPGCHNMEPYRTLYPGAEIELPQTERMVRRTLLLPTGTATDEQAIETIANVIRCAAENHAAISHRLEQQTQADLGTPVLARAH
jgi:dTDP-4-amino-4,6-dideoxygalactose transaminase